MITTINRKYQLSEREIKEAIIGWLYSADQPYPRAESNDPDYGAISVEKHNDKILAFVNWEEEIVE